MTAQVLAVDLPGTGLLETFHLSSTAEANFRLEPGRAYGFDKAAGVTITFSPQVPCEPVLLDGFELGDTSGWTDASGKRGARPAPVAQPHVANMCPDGA